MQSCSCSYALSTSWLGTAAWKPRELVLLRLTRNWRLVHDLERMRKCFARSPDECSCSLNLYSVRRFGANEPGDFVE